MDLEKIFDEVSNQMRSDFAKARESLRHPGLKGEVNEETVRLFLRQYLPRSLDISTGTLFDSNAALSKQLDVIISDADKTPIFFQSGHIRVIPAECVYAVIEIKAYLNKQELKKAYQNMKSVKAQAKIAYFKPTGDIRHPNLLYGKEWDYWPTHYFVFAYDSDSLLTILASLNELQNSEEVHQRIDSICVLNKGVILNRSRMVCFQPYHQMVPRLW